MYKKGKNKYLERIFKVVINHMIKIKQIGEMKSEARGYYFSMENQGSNIELYSIWHQNDQKLTTIKREFWKEQQHTKSNLGKKQKKIIVLGIKRCREKLILSERE